VSDQLAEPFLLYLPVSVFGTGRLRLTNRTQDNLPNREIRCAQKSQ